MFRAIDRGLTAFHAIAAAVIAAALYASLIAVAGPRLARLADGLTVFDLRFTGYSHAEAVALLAVLGAEGRGYYRGLPMLLDAVFPAFMFLATAGLFLWLTRPGRRFSVPLGDNQRLAVVAVAGLALVLDWAENVVVFLLLSDGDPSRGLVALGSTFTGLKWSAYAVALAALLVTLMLAVARGSVVRSDAPAAG